MYVRKPRLSMGAIRVVPLRTTVIQSHANGLLHMTLLTV